MRNEKRDLQPCERLARRINVIKQSTLRSFNGLDEDSLYSSEKEKKKLSLGSDTKCQKIIQKL